MRTLAIVTGMAIVLFGSAAARAQSADYSQNNYLNLAEIQQGAMANALQMRQAGVKNYLVVRQGGATNRTRAEQTGLYNGAIVGQYGDENAASFQQAEGSSHVLAPSGGRISRNVETAGGVTNYVTTYTNGPVSLLQVATQPQAFGRLGRR